MFSKAATNSAFGIEAPKPAQANHLQAFDRFDPLVYAETLDALSASARADQNPRLLVRVR
jgi:hypothetical protein